MQDLKLQEFSQMLLCGAERVIQECDKINEINVFPIPDSDTGNNLSVTLEGICVLLKKQSFRNFEELSRGVLNSAFISSQGNSGILMVSFLQGFFDEVLKGSAGKERVDFDCLIKAFAGGAKSARGCLAEPKNGTMLDVMDRFAESLMENKGKAVFPQVIKKALEDSREALVQTEKKIDVLRANRIVDAGALGIALFYYGFCENVTNEKLDMAFLDLLPQGKILDDELEENYYEVVFIVSNSLLSHGQMREMFLALGNSLDIAEIKDNIKVHIHTNEPEAVRETAYLTGEVRELKIVDMRLETHATVKL